MGFYIRKSMRVGPVRFNLSKSGIGASVGVRGLRLGTGPRGTYVHAGRGGLYYRQYLFTHQQSPRPLDTLPRVQPGLDTTDENAIIIASANASTISDSSAAALLEELRAKRHVMGLTGLGVIAGVIATLWAYSTNSILGTIILLLTVGGIVYLTQVDEQRRTAVVMYDLDGDAETAFRALYDGVSQMRQCSRLWSVSTVTANNSYKYNSGVGRLLERQPARVLDGTIKGLRTNVTIPTLVLHCDTLYFLPDHVLIENAGGIGGISYQAFHATAQNTRFVEDGAVPADAQQVGSTWRYLNKNGSPDRRFSNNPQLPILNYQEVLFASETGIRAYLQVSSPNGADAFLRALDGMRNVAKPDRTPPALPDPAGAAR